MTFWEAAGTLFRWWICTLILGLALWPLAFQCLKHLPDRGWAFARMIGLVGTGYLFWLGCWLRLWPNIPGAVWLCAGILFGLGTAFAVIRNENPWLWLRVHWKEALFTESVFLILFVSLSWIRAYDAGATHTERPMDLAFLNAILRSTYFPPNDPWLSGYAISYYHFGYILTGMLAKISGLTGGVAFSFGVTGSFSMAGLGAYGLLRNVLLLKAQPKENPQPDPIPSDSALPGRKAKNSWVSHFLWLPLLAPFTLLFLGNFEGSLEILYAQHVGWKDGQGAFWEALDINGLNVPPLGGTSLTPKRGGWWWWTAARVINDRDLNGLSLYDDGLIDEFPAFSFVIGDMHPHVLALPFLLLAVAVVLETLLRGGGAIPESKFDRWLFLAFSALSIGSLLFLNTWDILVFGMAAIAGYAGWKMCRQEMRFGVYTGWKAFGARWGLIGVLAVALFIPFLIGFSSQAGGILPNVLFPTKGGQFFVMFGTLFIPVGAWLILELWARKWKPDWKNGLLATGAGIAVLLVGSLIMAFYISLNPEAMISLGGILGGYGALDAMAIVLLRRFTDSLATLAPLALIAVALSILFGWMRKKTVTAEEEPDGNPLPEAGRWADAFLLILVLWGALLVLCPEYFYLRDFFGSRMNTVFKFYFQAWAFLSLAAAYGVIRLVQTALDKAEANNARWSFSVTGSVLVLFVLLLGSVYYPMAVRTKMNETKNADEPTFNASAYLRWNHPEDAAAIAWIDANISDAGPFVEALGNDYDEYAGRVATHTGIPSILGWMGHEDQWRGGRQIHGVRISDVQELFRTTDWTRALEILDAYGIRYVYFGPLEASTYGTRGLEKFRMHMNVIYETEEVVIFERAVP